MSETARQFFVSWLVGGLFVGALVGGVLALLVWPMVRHRRPSPRSLRRSAISDAIERAAARFHGANRNVYWYTRLKYRLDPCYAALAQLIPAQASVLDLGTGYGQLPLVLAELNPAQVIAAIEWDTEKAGAAGKALGHSAHVTLHEGDFLTVPWPTADVVTLVDVLHYLPPAEQIALCSRLGSAPHRFERIFIRDLDRSAKNGWTARLEKLAVRYGFNRAHRVEFGGLTEVAAQLRQLGYRVHQLSLAGPLHPGNVLLCAVRQTT